MHATTQALVNTATGRALPDALAQQVKADPFAGATALIRVTFTGAKADTPVLSQVSRQHGVDLNILHGRVETVAGQPFGTLIVSTKLCRTNWTRCWMACARRRPTWSCSAMSPEILRHVADATLDTLLTVALAGVFGTLMGLPLGVFLATSRQGELFAVPMTNRIVGLIVNAARSTPFIARVIEAAGSAISASATATSASCRT